jgi:ubiquinone biosynthesis protein COQ4
MRNPIQLARLFVSMTRLTLDLKRLDDVIAINDALMKLRKPRDTNALVAELLQSPSVAEALRTRHRLAAVDLYSLLQMPRDTLGGAYAHFMVERGLSPLSLPALAAQSEPDYILAHIYETHDLWHVVTGFDTDTTGETALQAFYLAQQRSYLPFFALSAVLLNTAFFAYDQKDARLTAMTSGWLLGKRAKKLLGIDWRAHFERPLTELRRELSLQRGESTRAAVS